jgi:protein SCO1/2
VAVDKTGRTVSISHEDIKGYMPGITMEFRFKDDWPLAVLVPGDQITGTLVVDGVSSWIEDPVITKEASADPNAKTSGLAEPKSGDEVPDFPLVNQNGKRIHLAQYRGKALLLTFIYTRCPLPEYCTLMSNNFHEIDQELRKLPDLYARTHLLSISIDPEYDTPSVLRSYGAAHTEAYQEERFEHWEFAAGTADEVKNIAQFFGMRYFRDTQSGEDQIIHGLRTAIIGEDGKLVTLYRGNEWKPKEVLDALKALPEPKR